LLCEEAKMQCVRCQCRRDGHHKRTGRCLLCEKCAFFAFDSVYRKPEQPDPVYIAARKEIFDDHASFFAELRDFSYEDLMRIKVAYLMAKSAHGSTVRSEVRCGFPVRYFEHVREAALIAIREYGVRDPYIIILILLHDTGEDSLRVRPEMLRVVFDQSLLAMKGVSVADGVAMLSKTPENKSGYLANLLQFGSYQVLFAKGCDRLHNLRTVSPDAREKQIKETEEKLYPVFDRMVSVSPNDFRAKSDLLTIDIHNTVAQLKKDAERVTQQKESHNA
jgi:hypothetical protein